MKGLEWKMSRCISEVTGFVQLARWDRVPTAYSQGVSSLWWQQEDLREKHWAAKGEDQMDIGKGSSQEGWSGTGTGSTGSWHQACQSSRSAWTVLSDFGHALRYCGARSWTWWPMWVHISKWYPLLVFKRWAELATEEKAGIPVHTSLLLGVLRGAECFLFFCSVLAQLGFPFPELSAEQVFSYRECKI